MKGQGSGFGWIFAIGIMLGIAVLTLTIVINNIMKPTEQLVKTTAGTVTNDLEMVKFAAAGCSMWRSAPIFFDAAALCPAIAEPIVKVFPTSDCSTENPVACEAACACLLKLQKYCNIGSSDASKSKCLNEVCRVQMEG